MNIESEEEILQTLSSLCPSPPEESPASANLVLQESSDEEEILQDNCQGMNLK